MKVLPRGITEGRSSRMQVVGGKTKRVEMTRSSLVHCVNRLGYDLGDEQQWRKRQMDVATEGRLNYMHLHRYTIDTGI